MIARLNVGGPARHVVLMSAGLDPARWRTVLATGRTDETEAEMLDLAEAAGLLPRIVPGLGRRLRPLRDLRAFFELLRPRRLVERGRGTSYALRSHTPEQLGQRPGTARGR